MPPAGVALRVELQQLARRARTYPKRGTPTTSRPMLIMAEFDADGCAPLFTGGGQLDWATVLRLTPALVKLRDAVRDKMHSAAALGVRMAS